MLYVDGADFALVDSAEVHILRDRRIIVKVLQVLLLLVLIRVLERLKLLLLHLHLSRILLWWVRLIWWILGLLLLELSGGWLLELLGRLVELLGLAVAHGFVLVLERLLLDWLNVHLLLLTNGLWLSEGLLLRLLWWGLWTLSVEWPSLGSLVLQHLCPL